MRPFDTPLCIICLAVAVISVCDGTTIDGALQCTREDDHVTCQATYEFDVEDICNAEPTQPSEQIRDCHDIYLSGSTSDGVYLIRPDGWEGDSFQVFCRMTEGGGWTVFQHRDDGSENFYRDWEDYKNGFGELSGDHWLGNEKLYYLTNQRDYKMTIDLKRENHLTYRLDYSLFRIGDEYGNYNLSSLGSFTGDTGYDYMNFHRNMEFSTSDVDNDQSPNSCAGTFRGGWWYNYCFDANLNGDYSSTTNSGVALYNRDTSTYEYNLRYTEMRVRPV